MSQASFAVPFEENVGQWDAHARYGARLGWGRVLITDEGPIFAVSARRHGVVGEPPIVATVALKFGNAPSVAGESELQGKANYFLGADPSRWRTGVPTFRSVRARNVTPGVDVVYRSSDSSHLEYDLLLAPHQSARALSFEVSGGVVALRADGSLEIRTNAGTLVQLPPRSFQSHGTDTTPVASRFRLLGENRVGFELDEYDPDQELVIDPMVSATYLGGSQEEAANGVALDPSGNVYLGGYTASPNFPTLGGVSSTFSGNLDAYVTKLNAAGTAILYSTYFGGSSSDMAAAIAVDAAGAVYVTGETGSSDLPTVNAFRSTFAPASDAFIVKLNPGGGSLGYSTYLGGTFPNGYDGGTTIAVDAAGSAYVAGGTNRYDFPTTPNVIQPSSLTVDSSFVTKLSPAGNALVFSTYFGGAGSNGTRAIAVDASGAVVIGGVAACGFPTVNAIQSACGGGGDATVTKLNPTATAMAFSTFVGGSGGDYINGLALGPTGRIYFAGVTQSPDFPLHGAYQSTLSGQYDGFVSVLEPDGSAFVYSTYLNHGRANAIAVDALGRATVVGLTQEPGFSTLGGFQSTLSGPADAFVLQLNAPGNALFYSTLLGGTSYDEASSVALGANGAWVAGRTNSLDLPTAAPVQGSFGGMIDAFLVRVTPPSLGVAPPTSAVPILQSKTFTAYGGSGVYTFSMQANPSGGQPTRLPASTRRARWSTSPTW